MEILKLNLSNTIHNKNHRSFRAGVKVATKPLHFLLTVHCYALHKIFGDMPPGRGPRGRFFLVYRGHDYDRSWLQALRMR